MMLGNNFSLIFQVNVKNFRKIFLKHYLDLMDLIENRIHGKLLGAPFNLLNKHLEHE